MLPAALSCASARVRRLGVLLLAAALGLVAALWTWTLPGDPTLFPPRADDPGVVVHILDNGFHTDLAVPRAAIETGQGPLAAATRSLAPGDWVLIGWGDAKFYVDQSPIGGRLRDGVRAFFHPGNASVVMLDPSRGDPTGRFDPDDRRAVRLSSAGFGRLRARIEGSLDVRRGGPRLVTARPGDDARFFASHERFWIGYLCNHWSARVMNAAGLPVRPLRAVTSAEVMRAVEQAAKLDSAAPRA